MSYRERGLLSFLLAGVWTAVWQYLLHYGPEFLRAIVYDKALHMMGPYAAKVLPYFIEYAPAAGLVLLGLYLYRRTAPAAAPGAVAHHAHFEFARTALSRMIRTAAVFWPVIVGCLVLVVVYFIFLDDDAEPNPAATVTVTEQVVPRPRPSSPEVISERAEELPLIYANRGKEAAFSYVGKLVKVSQGVRGYAIREVAITGERKRYIVVILEAEWGVFLVLDPATWQPIILPMKKGDRISATCKIHGFGAEERKRGLTLAPVFLKECEPSR